MKTWIWILMIVVIAAASAAISWQVSKKKAEKKAVDAYLKALKNPADPKAADLLQHQLSTGGTTPGNVIANASGTTGGGGGVSATAPTA